MLTFHYYVVYTKIHKGITHLNTTVTVHLTDTPIMLDTLLMVLVSSRQISVNYSIFGIAGKCILIFRASESIHGDCDDVQGIIFRESQR